MEEIILNLLAPNNDTIQKATTELKEAFKYSETVPALCELVVGSKNPQIRQYAAVILKRRLNKLRHWQMVPPDQQQIIKQGMLTALVQETEKAVRNAIAQLVGVLVRHEAEKQDSWMGELLEFIYTQCSSPDHQKSELGSAIFSTLTDAAPDQFLPYMDGICTMFTRTLMANQDHGNLASSTVFNMLNGMAYLVPFILGHTGAEHAYQKSIPMIIKALETFAMQPNKAHEFVRSFDVLECMADYTPKLLTANLKMLLEFCLTISSNSQLDGAIRVKTVAYIGWLVRLKKKTIIKQKMVEPIVRVIFNLMSTEPEGGDDDEEYFLGDDKSNPMTTATQTMDLMALNIPPEKLIPPLLGLLEPALQGTDPLPRRAAYLSMAVIAEGCSDAICTKYLETMLKIVKAGITDNTPLVRNAAFFALGQFSEHLQPEISKYAPEILPVLFDFLQQLCRELKEGATEPKHIDRMFYALETFCENMEDGLIPHLPVLMQRLFEALNPNNSIHVRELAMSAVSAAANASKEGMLPFFHQIIAILQPYLAKTTQDDILSLRPHAIDTFAALTRTIGKENFLPLANETMAFALALLEEAGDPDVRRSLYNLIASLAEVVNDQMAIVYPKIIDRMYDSILSTDEVVPEFKEDSVRMDDAEEEEEEEHEIDLDHTDDEDDLDNIAGYSVENSYLDEKEEAILALKEFAQHTGAAFHPYLEQSYQHVYKMIDHPQEDIRKVSIDALVSFVVGLNEKGNTESVTSAVNILLPKMGHIICEDEEISVVLSALEGLNELLKDVQGNALPTVELCDLVFACITDILQGKVACQFDDPTGDDEETETSEYDEAIVESAGNVLPYFGRAMQPEQFTMYFARALPLLLQKLYNAKKREELESHRSFVYGAIAECFTALQKYTSSYFDALCPVMMEGMNDRFDQARQNAIYGLGELILYSEDRSYELFPTALSLLSQAVAKEKSPSALDNICGAIARMIITNYMLVPLTHVLPVLFTHLPLRDDFDENAYVFKCFRILYMNARDVISQYLDDLVGIGVQVLYKKQYSNKDTFDLILEFLTEIRRDYPDYFERFGKANPDALHFLQALQEEIEESEKEEEEEEEEETERETEIEGEKEKEKEEDQDQDQEIEKGTEEE